MEQLRKLALVESDVELLDSFSSFSFPGISSGTSSESNSFEELTSHSSFSSPPSGDLTTNPLNDMSSLFRQLPMKRGLSKHYQGKSQSFTSLANVRGLEDLAKSENPHNKKLKYCRSCEEGSAMAKTQKLKCGPNAHSKPISKKGTLESSNSKKIYSSIMAKRISAHVFINSRPPMPPQRSRSATTNVSN